MVHELFLIGKSTLLLKASHFIIRSFGVETKKKKFSLAVPIYEILKINILFYFIYFSLIQFILTSASPFFLLTSPTSLLPQTHCSSISLQKSADLPGMWTKHSITEFNKNRPYNLISRQYKATQCEELGSKNRQKSQRHPYSHCQESNKTYKLKNHSMYAEGLM